MTSIILRGDYRIRQLCNLEEPFEYEMVNRGVCVIFCLLLKNMPLRERDGMLRV